MSSQAHFGDNWDICVYQKLQYKKWRWSRLNIKASYHQYMDNHYKEMSYIYNGNPFTPKGRSLYRDRVQAIKWPSCVPYNYILWLHYHFFHLYNNLCLLFIFTPQKAFCSPQYISVALWCPTNVGLTFHYNSDIKNTMASQITGVLIVFSTVCSGADKKALKLRVTGLCPGNPSVTSGFHS